MLDPVPVVIPNLNGLRLLGEASLAACLDAAASQEGVSAQVILVDNGSTDASVQWVQENRPDVEVLALPSNLGFAGGVNVGIRHALARGATQVALLNNDARPEPNWLANLVAVLEDPTVGIATCKFLRDDGRIDSTGDRLTTWGLPLPRGRDEVDDGRYDAPSCREVLSASGGATLFRAEMLRDIGLFDERFFAYYEDVDLALRARLRSWSVRYEPSAVAHHGVNRTSSTMPGLVEHHSLKNLLLLWMKDLPASLLARHARRFLVMLAFRIAFTARHAGVRVALRALLDAARYTPGALADRRQIQRGRTIAPSELERLLDHEWRPRSLRGTSAPHDLRSHT